MIISKTPLRVSFFGGGTDFPKFVQGNIGAVLSTAVKLYIYVCAKRRFDDLIRVAYTKTEIVESLDDLEHDLIRESMRSIGIEKGIEIATLADIPTAGTGLGSSGAVTVGALNALTHLQDKYARPATLAESAYYVEKVILKRPVGKQDMWASALGGMNLIQFHDEKVTHERVVRKFWEELERHLLLIYTERTRDAATILSRHVEKIEDNRRSLQKMAAMARLGLNLLEQRDFRSFGLLLEEAWLAKKGLVERSSTEKIDNLYDRLREMGIWGGKLCGAGGGGFLLVCGPVDVIRKIKQSDLRTLEVRIEPTGSRVLHV